MTVPGVVVAHRAGNDLDALGAARGHADVVEADVHLFRGRLEIRHAKTLGPVPILWERWHLVERTRPPLLLGALLEAVGPGVVLMLDLKGPDPRLPGATLAAVARWLDGRPLVVSGRVWRTIDRLRGTPGITAFHSAGSPRQVRALLRRYGPGSLEGVCARRDLLTRAVAGALRERAPRLWTWPVDDPDDARAIAAWGVTGFITDRPERLRP